MGIEVEVDLAAEGTEHNTGANESPRSGGNSTSPRSVTSGSKRDRRIPAASNAETAAAGEDNGAAKEFNGSDSCTESILVVAIALSASGTLSSSDWFTGVGGKYFRGTMFP
jgi:hypothetical protein